MRLLALIQRLLLQFISDSRTIIMTVVAPIIVLGLLYLITSSQSEIKVGVINAPASLYQNLNTNAIDSNITLVKLDQNSNNDVNYTDKQLKQFINQQHLVAIVNASNDLNHIDINLDASDSSSSGRVIAYLNKAIQTTLSQHINEQVEQIKQALINLQKQLQQSSQLISQAFATQAQAHFKPTTRLNQGKASLSTPSKVVTSTPNPALANIENLSHLNISIPNFSQPNININYVYGSSSTNLFDMLGAGIMGILIFMFIYILGGVNFLTERLSGTLDKMLSTPIRRWEIIFGYVGAFSILAITETVFISLFVVYVLKMTVVGSIGLVILINLLTALVALSLGFLISTISKSEFQLTQTIPMVITPQVFLCGLFAIGGIWVKVSYIIPLKYTVEALKAVMLKGYTISQISFDLYVLLGFFLVFMLVNILLLKGKRRV